LGSAASGEKLSSVSFVCCAASSEVTRWNCDLSAIYLRNSDRFVNKALNYRNINGLISTDEQLKEN
jgi:hypothetical protein